MAKRTAALVAAWTILLTGVAGAEAGPVWPCVVPVYVEAGPWRAAALGAVGQLDEATVISWPIVDERAVALVVVEWADLDDPVTGLATTWATDVEVVSALVEIDESVEPREVMRTLLHELGHVAGFDHNREVSVMGGGDRPFRRFTAWDLAALADVTCGG